MSMACPRPLPGVSSASAGLPLLRVKDSLYLGQPASKLRSLYAQKLKHDFHSKKLFGHTHS